MTWTATTIAVSLIAGLTVGWIGREHYEMWRVKRAAARFDPYDSEYESPAPPRSAR